MKKYYLLIPFVIMIFLGLLISAFSQSGVNVSPDGSASYSYQGFNIYTDKYMIDSCTSVSELHLNHSIPTQNFDICISTNREVGKGSKIERDIAGEWYDINANPLHITRQGKHYYCFENVHMIINTHYKYRLTFAFPPERLGKYKRGCQDKYGFFAKRSSDSLNDAITGGNYIELDPETNETWDNTLEDIFQNGDFKTTPLDTDVFVFFNDEWVYVDQESTTYHPHARIESQNGNVLIQENGYVIEDEIVKHYTTARSLKDSNIILKETHSGVGWGEIIIYDYNVTSADLGFKINHPLHLDADKPVRLGDNIVFNVNHASTEDETRLLIQGDLLKYNISFNPTIQMLSNSSAGASDYFRDTWTRGDFPNRNHGADTDMSLYQGSPRYNVIYNNFAAFIPAGSTVTGGNFTYATGPNCADVTTVKAYAVAIDQPFDEGTGTFGAPCTTCTVNWTTPYEGWTGADWNGGDTFRSDEVFTFSTSTTISTPYHVDITNFSVIEDMINGDYGGGVFLIREVPGQAVDCRWQTREGALPWAFNIAYEEPPIPLFNVSYEAVNLNVSDFTFASSSFVPSATFTLNHSDSHNFTLFGSMGMEKLSGVLDNDVSGRILIDGVVVQERILNSLTSTGQVRSSGFTPFIFELADGSHNISLEYSRSGDGSILVNDHSFVLVHNELSDGSDIFGFQQDFDTAISSSSFSEVFNLSLDNALSFYGVSVFDKLVGGSDDLEFFIRDTEDSPLAVREISVAGASGSSAFGFNSLEGGVRDVSLLSRSVGGDTFDINGSLVGLPLVLGSNTVQSFSVSNENTTGLSTVTYGSGNNTVLSVDLDNVNNSGMVVFAGVSLESLSGDVEVILRVEGDNGCSSSRVRSLNGGVGNLYLSFVCEDLSSSLDLVLEVSAGDSVSVLDESFWGFESQGFDVVEELLSPVPNVVNSPVNGSFVSGVVGVDWENFLFASSYDVNITSGSDFEVCSGVVVSSCSFNSSLLSDGNYELRVYGFNSEGVGVSPPEDFSIDNSPPVVSILSPDGSNLTHPATIDVSYNVSDSGVGIVSSCSFFVNDVLEANDTVSPFDSFSYAITTDFDGSIPWNFSVGCSDSLGNVGEETVSFLTNFGVDFGFRVGVCFADPDEGGLGLVLLFGIVLGVVAFLIWLGVKEGVGIFLVLASLMLLVCSWFVAGCHGLLGGLFIGVGVVLLAYSVFGLRD